MDVRRRQRGVHVTPKQKKKLIALMGQHPELVLNKVTQDFTRSDAQRLWQSIANELNALAGARKTWRQWRKTWQDLRCKIKKRQSESYTDVVQSPYNLTPEEQDALGINTNDNQISSDSQIHETTEFVQLELSAMQNENFNLEEVSAASVSEQESIPETKVFINSTRKSTNMKKKHSSVSNGSKHSNCYFNCEMLSAQEQRKIQMKEDYLNFKKDYLRQKLKLLKEQTEALKSIARELSK